MKSRNQKIYEAVVAGKTYRWLASKWGVSYARIYQIFDAEHNRRNKVNAKDNVFSGLSNRAQLVLKLAEITTIKDLEEYPALSLLKLRNCGRKTTIEILDWIGRKQYTNFVERRMRG